MGRVVERVAERVSEPNAPCQRVAERVSQRVVKWVLVVESTWSCILHELLSAPHHAEGAERKSLIEVRRPPAEDVPSPLER